MVTEYFPVLAARAEQRAGSLSGGEQQMLAIGRALMARPKVMLLDEPSLGLAPKLVKDIFDIIRRINRERGVTVLLVEQNANLALQTADYGYVLELGRIVMKIPASGCSRRTISGSSTWASRSRASAHAALEKEKDMALTTRPATLNAGTGICGNGAPGHGARSGHPAQALPPRGAGAWRPGGDAGEAPRDLAAISWREYGRQARAVGARAGGAGRPPRGRVSILADNCRSGLHRSRRDVGRGHSQRVLYHRLGGRGRVHRQRQRHPLPLRGERGAARQGAGSPRALPGAGEDLRLRRGRAARLPGRPGDDLRGPPRAGRRPRPRASRGLRPARRAPPPRGSGHPGIHLRHHRPAQGGDAEPPQYLFQLEYADSSPPREGDQQLSSCPSATCERTFTVFNRSIPAPP